MKEILLKYLDMFDEMREDAFINHGFTVTGMNIHLKNQIDEIRNQIEQMD